MSEKKPPEHGLPIATRIRKVPVEALGGKLNKTASGRKVLTKDECSRAFDAIGKHFEDGLHYAAHLRNPRTYPNAYDPGPFPMEQIEDILASPEGGAFLYRLLGQTRKPHRTAFLANSFAAWLSKSTGRGAAGTHWDDYGTRYFDQYARVWELAGARAEAEAKWQNVEFTPTLDLLWMLRDRFLNVAAGREMSGPAAPSSGSGILSTNRDSAPEAPLTREILSADTEGALLEQAFSFKSPPWRQVVLASSSALANPEHLIRVLETFDAEGVDSLVSNPALSQETIDLLQEWALMSISEGHPGDKQIAILNGLEKAGHHLDASQRKRVLMTLRIKTDPDQLRGGVARIPALARDPQILEEIMRVNRVFYMADVSSAAQGPAWMAMLKRMDAEQYGDTYLDKALAMATSYNVEGLTRESLLDLVGSDKPNRREHAFRLIGTLPAGPAPALPQTPAARARSIK